jgi:hypothetical protein
MDLIAADRLAGDILTWALPLAVLIGVVVYWLVVLRRGSSGGT